MPDPGVESGVYRPDNGRYGETTFHPGAAMIIEGVSPSTGVERRVEVVAATDGVRVGIRDRRLGSVLAFVTAPADEWITILTDRPEGPQTITGDTAGAARTLRVEVRRNEVLL